MAPIPIALCGKSSGMASSFSEKMLPEYEIVHHFQSTPEVHKQLPGLLRGDAMKPLSGVGTNAQTDQLKIPQAIMVGRGFSEAELDEMRTAEGARTVPWMYPDPLKSVASMVSGPFLLDVITKRSKACLQSHGLEEGKEVKEKDAVWYF